MYVSNWVAIFPFVSSSAMARAESAETIKLPSNYLLGVIVSGVVLTDHVRKKKVPINKKFHL